MMYETPEERKYREAKTAFGNAINNSPITTMFMYGILMPFTAVIYLWMIMMLILLPIVWLAGPITIGNTVWQYMSNRSSADIVVTIDGVRYCMTFILSDFCR